MNYFMIQDKLTQEYVNDLDDEMGICWYHDKSEGIVFINDIKTTKWLARIGLNNGRYYRYIECDEYGMG